MATTTHPQAGSLRASFANPRGETFAVRTLDGHARVIFSTIDGEASVVAVGSSVRKATDVARLLADFFLSDEVAK